MNKDNPRTGIPLTAADAPSGCCAQGLSWRAILAGTVAGLAVHLLLALLGIGLGIGAVEPTTDESPIAKLGIGTAIAWCASSLIALFVGGWVAGRFTPAGRGRSGWLHGFLVWCLATLAIVYLATSGIGMAVSGAANAVTALGKPVAAAASGLTDVAKDTVKQNTDVIASYVDEAMQARGQNQSPGSEARAKRQIGYALGQLFRPGEDLNNQEKRRAAVAALAQAGVEEPRANELVDEWTRSYQGMKADLDQATDKLAQKAREKADAASDAVGQGAIWGFVAFLLGAIVATLGGKAGEASGRRSTQEDATTAHRA